MRRAGAHGGGHLPSSSLRGAKQSPASQHSRSLVATVANSKYRSSLSKRATSRISSSNKTALFSIGFEFQPPAPSIRIPISNRPLETIRDYRNLFTIMQMTFSNRPKKTRSAAGAKTASQRQPARTPALHWGGRAGDEEQKQQRRKQQIPRRPKGGLCRDDKVEAMTPAGCQRYEGNGNNKRDPSTAPRARQKAAGKREKRGAPLRMTIR